MQSCHLNCSGKFPERKKLPFYYSFARFELSSSHFNQEEMGSLMHFPVIVKCLAWRTIDFKAIPHVWSLSAINSKKKNSVGKLVHFINQINTRIEK